MEIPRVPVDLGYSKPQARLYISSSSDINIIIGCDA